MGSAIVISAEHACLSTVALPLRGRGVLYGLIHHGGKLGPFGAARIECPCFNESFQDPFIDLV